LPSSFFPADAISSARASILVKYSLMEDAYLDAVVSAMRVLITRAQDWEANVPSMGHDSDIYRRDLREDL
jgi:hypothetical protein